MPEDAEPQQPLRLLVVEDDTSQLRTLTVIMEAEGFHVIACSSGRQAVEQLGREPAPVAVVDLRLPDLAGADLLEKLRECDPDVHIVIYTAFGSFDSAKDALNLGAFAYVEKAGDPDELVRHVHRAFQARLRRHTMELESAVADRTCELLKANQALKQEIVERKRAEEGLTQAAQNWQGTLDAMQDLVMVVDSRLRIVRANRAAHDGFGRDIVGAHCYELVHGTEAPISACPSYEAMSTGEPQHCELQEVHLNGRWFDVYSYPIKDRRGMFHQAVHVLRDISERKRSEDKLARSEARYRELADFLPQGVFELDENGDFTFANRGAFEMSGYAAGDVETAINALQLFVPEDRVRAKENMRKVMAGERLGGNEYTARRKDGTTFPVLVYAAPIVHENKAVGLRGIIIDITERKRAEEALRKSEDSYRSLFTHMLVGFAYCRIVLDENNQPTDFVYLDINDSFERLTGLRREDVVGKRVTEAIPTIKDTHPELFDIYGDVAQTGKPARFEIYFEPLKIWLWIAVYSPEKGYFVAVFDNITERKRAEEALRESEETLRLIVETAFDGISISEFDPRTRKRRLVLCNERYVEMSGYGREELSKADNLNELVTQDSPEEPDGHLYECILKGVPFTGSASWKRPDGKENTYEYTGVSVKKGEKLHIIGVDRDITERRRTEAALHKALSEIRTLKERVEAENVYLRREIRTTVGLQAGIVGESNAVQSVLAQVEQVARTDCTVLILGETGTGKELTAQAIHSKSPRSALPLVIVNCAAITPTLVESELFGHEKGAFTGAIKRKIGRFEVANGSTIFLDEIGDLSLDIQAKLLRVLQDGRFERVGDTKTISVDVRVITATNRDLEREVQEGRFRGDLFYRLDVFPITMPPLRERRDDIPTLAKHFITHFAEKMNKRTEPLSPQSEEALRRHSWPGNVRELRNVIERAMILAAGSRLEIELPMQKPRQPEVLMRLDEVERKHIVTVLNRTSWRVRGEGAAAEVLGLRPTTLESRMKKLGIERSK